MWTIIISGYSHFEFSMHLLDSQCWSPISRLISKNENDKVTKNNVFSVYVTFRSYFNVHSTKIIKPLVILLEMSAIHMHPWTHYSFSLPFNTRLKKDNNSSCLPCKWDEDELPRNDNSHCKAAMNWTTLLVLPKRKQRINYGSVY